MACPTHFFLSFLLPQTLMAPIGRHQPCRHGCVLKVARGGLVTIEGPSREGVIDQAKRFVRILARGRVRVNPIGVVLVGPHGRDHGWLTVNTDVVFSWGGVEPVADQGRVA